MPFTNPLVAGNTLIREAIQSPNYVAGVSGWAIFKNGSAEFNNVTVRGDFIVNGTNNSSIVLTTIDGNPRVELHASEIPGYNGYNAGLQSGQIVVNSLDGGTEGTTRTQFFVIAPGPLIQPQPYMEMLTKSYDGITDPLTEIVFSTFNSDPGNTLVTIDGFLDVVSNIDVALDANIHGAMAVIGNITGLSSVNLDPGNGSRDIGRGRLFGTARTSVSGSVGPAEAVAWTLPSQTFYANRAYEVRGQLAGSTSVASATVFPRLRKGLAGTVLLEWARTPVGPGIGTVYAYITNPGKFVVGGSNVTTALTITLTNSSGTSTLYGVAGSAASNLAFYDIGAAADILADEPNVAVLT